MVTSIRRSFVIATLALLAGTASAQTIVRGPVQRPNDPSRYYVIQGANWTQLRDFARSMGGDLTTVNDAAENAFIVSSVLATGEKAFNGLNDLVTEGTLVWSDGSSSSYRNWTGGGGPNNTVNEDVTVMRQADAQWSMENQTFTPFAVVEIRGPVRLPGEASTFANAVAAASLGPREILLGPGTFTPVAGQDVLTALTIRGSGVGVTTLQSVVGNTTLDVLADLVVENLTLDQRTTTPMFDFDVNDKRLLVRNCEVTSSVGRDSGELVRMESSIVTFESCLIHNIDAASEAWLGASQARYINCVIRDVDTISRRDTSQEVVFSTFVNCTITRVTDTLSSVAADNAFSNTIVLGEANVYNAAQLRNTIFTANDPGFVNVAANNFALLPTSSLIDAGAVQAFLAIGATDFTDFAGNSRGVDITAIANAGSGALALDIGAYEFQNQIGCDDIDFNNNGVFPEDQDVIDFFTVLAGGDCPQ